MGPTVYMLCCEGSVIISLFRRSVSVWCHYSMKCGLVTLESIRATYYEIYCVVNYIVLRVEPWSMEEGVRFQLVSRYL